MKIKDIHEFSKNISKTRVMQVGAVCIGAFLITNCALQLNETEVANNFSQENEWKEPTYPYTFIDKKVIRDYEKYDGKYELNATFTENLENDFKIESDSNSWYTWTEDKISDSVIRGDYGNGEERKQLLEEAGYNYENIQSLVNLKCFNQDYDVYASECVFNPDMYVPLSSRLGSFPNYIISNNGATIEKSGYFTNYLDENGELQTAYYDDNDELISDTKEQEKSR